MPIVDRNNLRAWRGENYVRRQALARRPAETATAALPVLRLSAARRPHSAPKVNQLPHAQAAAVMSWLRLNYSRIAVVIVLLLTMSAPLIEQVVSAQRYKLTPADQQVIGKSSHNLDAKLTYDGAKQLYQFNKDGLTKAQQASDPKNPIAKLMHQQVGGADSKNASQLYSVDLPENLSKGITIYDNNTNLSFKLIPDFSAAAGRLVSGHLIYPISGGHVVYTLKGNGLKEDVLLDTPPKDGKFDLSYHLSLPGELASRVQNDGSVGVFSADASFYGNISYGDQATENSIMQARKTGQKNNLVFALPAPIISQHGLGKGQGGSAQFSLNGNNLRLQASHLQGLQYPLSIDPSVVIPSSSSFATGNNEGNIDYPSTSQINRGGLTGGTLSSTWASTSGFTNSRAGHASVAYNGYLYIIGGANNGTYYNDIQYAPINTNGTVGAWQYTYNSASSASFVGGFATARYGHTAAAYDGYLYITGGLDSSVHYLNDVQYAPINSNGTIGTWSTTTSFTTGRYYHTTVSYNGYLYVLGGQNSANGYLNDVQYVQVNANGTLGTWATTTSFTTVRSGHTSVIYNGYLYVLGGQNSANGYLNDVQYVQVNANGTLGTWATTTSFTTVRSGHTSVIYNGYLYVLGGQNSANGYLNDVQYVQVNANGTVGTWAAATSFTNIRAGQTSVAYNGYLYVIGGQGISYYNDVQYNSIQAAGSVGNWNTTTSIPLVNNGPGGIGGTNFGTYNHTSVAYNGYVYVIGGHDTAATNKVLYAPINANGTLGTWTATTSLPAATELATSVAYNGYVYEIGGNVSGSVSAVVEYSPINANGTLGTWTATTSLLAATQLATSVAYNGYVYEIGGNGGGPSRSQTVEYVQINANGTLGSWNTTSSLYSAIKQATSVVSNGFIYVLGGYAVAGSTSLVQYAQINADGTLGTWASTTSLTYPSVFNATSVVYNGNIYLIGGWDYTTIYGNVRYAPINADGSLGSWVNTTALTTPCYSHTSVVYKGIVYVIGGNDGTSNYNTATSYAPIYNGGTGDIGAWSATTSFSNVRYSHTSVAYNGYLYVVGGNNLSGYYNDVQYAPINANGTIGAWNSTNSFSTPRNGQTSVAYNGYLYVIGGADGFYGDSYHNDVQYARINADGSVGSWITTNPFTTARANHTSVVYGGYLYVIGGQNGAYNSPAFLNDVQYAPIKSNGTVGVWTATTAFAVARAGHTSVAYNGYLYVIGGTNNLYGGNGNLNDVQYSAINTNGTVGTWSYTTSFSTARDAQSTVAYNGYLYILGGAASNNTGINDVQYAALNVNGSVGAWNTASSFATGRFGHATVAYNGYIYITGGTTANTLYNDVQFAPLSVMSRRGVYTKLVDLGSSSLVTSIISTGTLPSTSTGVPAVSYKYYASDAVTQNGSGYANAVDGTVTTSQCGVATTRYVFIKVVLDDDFGSGIFTDSLGTNNANLTGFTINYSTTPKQHPATNLRLRGGKYFSSNVQQPLDTCGI